MASFKLMDNELVTLKKLDHPNIMQLYEVYEEPNMWYLVTEMCTGGQLFEQVISKGSISEHEAATIIKQVLSAIAYCHS